MRKVEDILRNVRFGSIIKIYKKQIGEISSYYGCMIKYDGRIFKDVESLKVFSFLNNNRNIMNDLDDNSYLKISYDYNMESYKSVIMHYEELDNDIRLEEEDTLKNNISSTIEESINGLDDIIKFINRNKRKIKKIS